MENSHSAVSGKHNPKSDAVHGAKKESLSPLKRDKTEEYLKFQEIWNNAKKYPSVHDLTRTFDTKWKSIRAQETKFREYQREHPDMELPVLVVRKMKSGRLFAIPEKLLKRLDFFRLDSKELKDAKGIVVTSGQFKAALNPNVWKSLEQYCKYRKFILIVLPILQYGKVKEDDEFIFPEEFKGHVAFDDILLQSGTLNLSTMGMLPTLSKFLTEKICQMGGTTSQIIPAPKFELKHRPSIGGNNHPRAIMTTGSVTQPNYAVDQLGQTRRVCEIATKRHAYGAIVVEFDGKKKFHFRQLMSEDKETFYDIDTIHGGARLFTPFGNEHKKNGVGAYIPGDWHCRKTDPVVRLGTFEGKDSIVSMLQPSDIVLHDYFDAESINHHDDNDAIHLAYKALVGWNDLERELRESSDGLKWMQKRTDATIHVIAANHNGAVKRWLLEKRWVNDPVNYKIGLRLSLAMIEDLEKRKPKNHEASSMDPVAWYLRENVPGIKTYERRDILFLPTSLDGQEKKQILVSMHGDEGILGGKAGGLNSFLKMGGVNLIIGHGHSGEIDGPIMRVGTSTYLVEHYMNTPATSWSHSGIVIFENGQRQMINFVGGKWHG
jgi:hypothetical protein